MVIRNDDVGATLQRAFQDAVIIRFLPSEIGTEDPGQFPDDLGRDQDAVSKIHGGDPESSRTARRVGECGYIDIRVEDGSKMPGSGSVMHG